MRATNEKVVARFEANRTPKRHPNLPQKTVPGDNFYSKNSPSPEKDECIRFCFCRDVSDLQEAVSRLQKLKELS